MSKRRVASGDPIVASGECDSRAVVIHSGIGALVHTYQDGRRQVLELLFAGDLLVSDYGAAGETCLLQAVTDVSVCEADGDALFEDALDRPEIARALFGVLRGSLLRKNRRLLDLGRKNAGERVASFLIEYGERSTSATLPGGPIRLMVPRGVIADLLCLTRETISRCMALFRDEGLIRTSKHDEVEIIDLPGLRRRARGEDEAVRP